MCMYQCYPWHDITIMVNHQKYYETKLHEISNFSLSWFQFICAVEDTKQVHDDLSDKFPNRVLLSELEYIPRTLVSLSDEPLQQAEKLIDTLEEHLDVMRVYDNIEQYPSTTCKLFGSTWPSSDVQCMYIQVYMDMCVRSDQWSLIWHAPVQHYCATVQCCIWQGSR